MRTNKTIAPNDTVADIVVRHPALSRVFESMRIDYCCGGNVPLKDAASQKGVDVTALVGLLHSAMPTDDASEARPTELDTPALIAHIVDTHHAFLRRELPRLVELAAKVADAHGDADVRLYEVVAAVSALAPALIEHLEREEQELFPASAAAFAATDSRPIDDALHHDLVADHQEAGDALDQLRDLTDGYTLPEWGCNTYRALLDGLAELERDTHQHVHLENNVLFPRLRRE